MKSSACNHFSGFALNFLHILNLERPRLFTPTSYPTRTMKHFSVASTNSASAPTDFVGVAIDAVSFATGHIEWLALALAIYSCWKTHSVKSLDLRVELRKCRNEVHEKCHVLRDLIKDSDKSRQRVSAAMGQRMTERWREGVEKDKEKLECLLLDLSDEQSISSVKHKALEEKLGECHRIKLQIDSMLSKYRDALSADDKVRDRIHANNRLYMPITS